MEEFVSVGRLEKILSSYVNRKSFSPIIVKEIMEEVKKEPVKEIHLLGCSGCKYFDSRNTLLICKKHGIHLKNRYTQPCTEFERRK